MPLYAYRCTQCGHLFEKIQSFSATPESICPQCGGPLERPLTAPAFNFKGAGWYVNDYASRPSSKTDNKPGDGASAPPADAKPSTDSKPAAESKPASTDSAAKPASSASTSSTT